MSNRDDKNLRLAFTETAERRKRETAERLERAVKMYLDGAAVIDICRSKNIGDATLYKALAERGIPRRGHSSR